MDLIGETKSDQPPIALGDPKGLEGGQMGDWWGLFQSLVTSHVMAWVNSLTLKDAEINKCCRGGRKYTITFPSISALTHPDSTSSHWEQKNREKKIPRSYLNPFVSSFSLLFLLFYVSL